MASLRSSSVSSGRRRTEIAADVGEGKKAENLDLGTGSVKRLSKTTARTNCRVPDRGEALQPILHAERDGLLEELVLDRLRRGVGGGGCLFLAEPLLDRRAVGLLRRGLALLLGRGLLLLELLGRLGRELVEEGRGPVDDPRGLRVRQVVAHLRRLDALGDLTLRRGAGQAGLEEEDALKVLGQDELLQVALDEDDDGVVAELLLELLGRLERLRALVDEGVRLAVRLQAQRADHAQDRQQHRERDNRPRTLDTPRPEACENAPHTNSAYAGKTRDEPVESGLNPRPTSGLDVPGPRGRCPVVCAG